MDLNGENNLKTPLVQPLKTETGIQPYNTATGGKYSNEVKFKIGGMKCASCVVSIESTIGNMEGIESIAVSALQGQAVVKYRPEVISVKKIFETIEDLGYQVDKSLDQDISVCRLRLKGMVCTSCSEAVERALGMVNGIKKAVVGLALEEAKIHYDPSIISPDQIIKAIEDSGFGAELISSGDGGNKVHLKIEGITSEKDANSVQSYLELVEGVNHVEMDVAAPKITVSYDPDVTGPRSLIQCIQEAGPYNASLYNPPRRREIEREEETRVYRNQFLWSCLFSVPLIMFSMVLPMISPYGDWLDNKIYNNLSVGILLRWILCTPVQFIIGWRFYTGSYHALKRGSSNMDVLVAMGTNAAYFYSLYIVVKALFSDSFEGQDFFETSGMLISFIILGKYLEVVAKGKTSDALAKLTDLAPATAFLIDFDEEGNTVSEKEISTQLLQRNDVIKVMPGSKVPVDGVVIRGQSYVNESMITGESRPVSKKQGDKVIGGTMNENGFILIKATHVGSETALSQIVQLVEAAQLARAPVQKLADKISRYFVPTIILVAFLTWLGWFIFGKAHLYPSSWIPKSMNGFELALQFGISVLVVACPCALGLATPTAVMVATGKGASQGVLIKGGNALEKAHKVKTVVFDKTGTLTIGKPSVVHTMLFSNMGLQEFSNLAAAAEVNSEHPLAKAIVDYTKSLHSQYGSETSHLEEVKDFEVHPGAGVTASIGGRKILVGNKKHMFSSEIPLTVEVEKYMKESEQLARTCVLVAIDGVICGAFAISDPLKPESSQVISFLESMGISSIMVTGDNWATAIAIGKEIGISTVFAETDPAGKAKKIKELQAKGVTVAMVGDGINDSPALAAADVGMAIGAGTDVAIEAADIVLMKSNLEDVITAIDLSRKTLSRIRLNYVWALGYNVLGVPVAAGILYPIFGIRLPPWLAGACMAASSISVVCSSLMLQSYKKPFHLEVTNKNAQEEIVEEV